MEFHRRRRRRGTSAALDRAADGRRWARSSRTGATISVSQRTLDLKIESAYFRVRLCVPRPRARPASLRPFNHQPSAHPPVPRFPHRSQRARRVLETAERGRVRHGDHARARKDPRRRRGRDTHRPTLVRARDGWDETGARTRRDHRMRLRRRRAMPRRRRARKVRTALAMLTTTHDGTECRASVLGEARSLVPCRRVRPRETWRGGSFDYRAPSL